MILMAVGALMAPSIHAIAKTLGETMSAGQTAWARFFLTMMLLLPLLWINNRGRIPMPSSAHALRGLLLAATSLFFFWALRYIPLANAAAIFFVEPLILTAISALFLGEPVGPRRIIAVAVGFVGALVVIRPSMEIAGAAALLPLLAAVCFAVYLAITRHQAAAEAPLVTQFWICVFAALVLGLAIAFGTYASADVLRASLPSLREAGLLVLMAVLALVTQGLAIYACRLAPISALAPFQYLEIIGAIILGAIVFGDRPDTITMLGTVTIIGSGLYVFHRERKQKRRAR
jgi:drug/metabolite transporter (DMT)-like permease